MTQPSAQSSSLPLLEGQTTYVEAVGTRPWAKRALSKVYKGFVNLSAGAIVGLVALSGPVAHDATGMIRSHVTEGGSSAKIEATAENIHWLDLPKSPLIEAGWTEHGEFSNVFLMERWWAAGIPAQDFDELLLLGRATAPVIMGTVDPAMEQEFMIKAAQAVEEMASRWPEAIRKLSDPQWLADHTYIETDEHTSRLIEEFEAAIIQEVAIDAVNGNDDYIDVETHEEAKRLMERAMHETGLRSFRMSSPWARDPYVMANVAYKLIQSNEQLRARTGWEGGVLGLGGRVDLVLATGGPEYHGAASAPIKRRDGTSNLWVIANFDTLPHEWFHALDFVIGREVLMWSHGGPLNDSLQYADQKWGSYVLHRHGALLEAVNHARKELPKVAPDWAQARKAMLDRSGDDYWKDHAEMMAFAFTGQIYKWETTSFREPSMHEADLQSPMFDAIFEEAGKLNLTMRLSPTKIDPSSWNLTAQPSPPAKRSP